MAEQKFETDAARTILIRAGWFPGRRIQLDEVLRLVSLRGYTVFLPVKTFLLEFGMLHCLNEEAEPPTPANWHFDAGYAAMNTPHRNVESVVTRLRLDLCVIGEASNDHLVLLMDHIGRVYGEYADEIFFLGHSGHQAIDALASGHGIKKLTLDKRAEAISDHSDK